MVSQARSRTITSPTRTAWPGLSVSSRDAPLRLLSSPSTATRSAIGVVPGASRVTVCGTSIVWFSISAAFCRLSSSAPRGEQAASAIDAASPSFRPSPRIAQSGVQA